MSNLLILSVRIPVKLAIIIAFASSIIASPIMAEETIPEESSSMENNYRIILPFVMNGSHSSGWIMAGANPERSSWVPDEVRGELNPIWFKRIEPYIQPKVQIVAAYDTLFIGALGQEAPENYPFEGE